MAVVFGGLLLFLATAAVGVPSDSKVQNYFHDLKSLQADFVQTIFDEKGRTLETSRGQMFMQKPGRFHWDYREPATQLIVADGRRHIQATGAQAGGMVDLLTGK